MAEAGSPKAEEPAESKPDAPAPDAPGAAAKLLPPLQHPLSRKFAIPFSGACAGLAVVYFAVTFLGSASDGSPSVEIRLEPAKQLASDAGPAVPASSFLPARKVAGQLVADPELIDDSFEGPLPKISAAGRAPMTAYAMPVDKNDKRPKVAVVISGLGIGMAATDLALKTLPPQVTLAFVPYGQSLQSEVDRARGAGHEVLLQVPMEPFDFPNSDPGPHALLVNATAEENMRRFNWAMSRFTGYAGYTNLLGARFLGEAGAIEPVLAEGAKRGLMFFDNGASTRSLASTAARHANATIATGTLALDDIQSAAAIDTKLVQLETQAKRDGFAIGTGQLYPVTVNRVADWAMNAGARGILVVPVSALAGKPDAMASASAR
jgi:uncharacterized protein